MKRFKNKNIIAACLALTIIITGAFALFVSQDTKENVFAIGDVNVKLIETFDVNKNNIIDDNETFINTQPEAVTGILPNQTLIKSPYIQNVGKNDAWVYMTVQIPVGTEESFCSADGTTPFILQIAQKIIVTGYGIQDYSGATYESLWDEFMHKTTEIDYTSMFGAERVSALEPVFHIGFQDKDSEWNVAAEFVEGVHAGESYHWKELAQYQTEKYNCYVYAYDTKLSTGDTTDLLFDTVRVNPEIGNRTLDLLTANLLSETPVEEVDIGAPDNPDIQKVRIGYQYVNVGRTTAKNLTDYNERLEVDDDLTLTSYSPTREQRSITGSKQVIRNSNGDILAIYYNIFPGAIDMLSRISANSTALADKWLHKSNIDELIYEYVKSRTTSSDYAAWEYPYMVKAVKMAFDANFDGIIDETDCFIITAAELSAGHFEIINNHIQFIYYNSCAAYIHLTKNDGKVVVIMLSAGESYSFEELEEITGIDEIDKNGKKPIANAQAGKVYYYEEA